MTFAKKYNLAMLFITHDLLVAAQICHRLIVMQKGVVVEEGATQAVYSNPSRPYTRQSLYAPPDANVQFWRGAKLSTAHCRNLYRIS
jgi:peptide/nickel transport system ATP-binding protein